MHPLKSPRPDGFSGIFYRKYWRIVGDQVCAMVQEFFTQNTVSSNLNHTFLCLIPKTTNACRFDHFQPISLCNFCYKIISRILTDRLKGIIDKLVSPTQSAFIPGRWIAECSILAQEVLHSFKNKKGKQGVMAIKTDMSKAYDRLEWSFLLRVLQANGLCAKACNLIMSCVTSVSYSILLNRAPLAPFNPKRGLRQGDPLSHFLFILCSEVLSKLISKAENRGEFSGIKVSRNVMPISHLFYADDAIFFCNANSLNAKTFAECITTYEKWSGQLVNKRKSGLVFSPNTHSEIKVEVKRILDMNFLSHEGKYLRNPFFFSASKRKDFHFIKDKIMARLEGWKAKCLSQAGRTTLVGSVLQSIPTYFMSTARPKNCGGLGLRRFGDTNLALLAKLCWMMMKEEDKFWVKILQSKYYSRLDIWKVDKQAGDSRVWQGILEARAICKNGAGILIGKGDTELWDTPWIPRQSMEKIKESFQYSRRHRFCQVSDLFMEGTRRWNEDIIRSSFRTEMATAILQINPLLTDSDILFRKASKSGTFSVKSVYGLSQQLRFKEKK
uniref:Reverse transcriptase domain-containing protein n=1 Tax=Cannabis sativa TaxID=3483 RepID=A0A803Q4P7_CANSA